jgi:hypothetical protein
VAKEAKKYLLKKKTWEINADAVYSFLKESFFNDTGY